MSLHFTIPPTFTENHRRAVYQYQSAPEGLSPNVWATLFEAMDLLRTALVRKRFKMPQTLDDLTNEEFEQLIDQYIERSAQWDGALPLDSMLETWAEIERRKEPLLVRVRLIDGMRRTTDWQD